MTFEYGAYHKFFEDLAANESPYMNKSLTHKEIDQLERRVNRYIPKAVRAYLNVIGAEYRVWSRDHTTHDVEASIGALHSIIAYNEIPNFYLADPTLLPVMHRMGDYVYFLEAESDDPPVYLCHYDGEVSRIIDNYTTFMREAVIRDKDNDERSQEIVSKVKERVLTHTMYSEKQAMIDKFRDDFLNKVYHEDEKRGTFTSLNNVQKRWVREFSEHELWKDLRTYGFNMMPYSVFAD